MNFRHWLETFTMGDFMNWHDKKRNQMYEKGVRDAMDDNYDPPAMGSPLSSQQRMEYMDGWRSMGKRIPPGRTSRSSLSDREWYAMKLREKRYGAANPGPINIVAANDPKWNDPDYDPDVG